MICRSRRLKWIRVFFANRGPRVFRSLRPSEPVPAKKPAHAKELAASRQGIRESREKVLPGVFWHDPGIPGLAYASLAPELPAIPPYNERGLLAEPSENRPENRGSYIAALAVRWISVAHIFPSFSL